MKKVTLVLLLALLIMIAACAKKQPVAAPLYVPPEPACAMDVKECLDGTAVYRVPPDCQFAACPQPEEPFHQEGLGRPGDGADILQRDGDESDILSDLACDLDNNKLSVVLTNPLDSDVTYGLKRYSALNMPKGISAARISLNGRLLRDMPAYCDGAETLEAGESALCVIDFVPNSLSGNIMVRTGLDEKGQITSNRLHFSSLDHQSELDFICD